MLRRHFLEAVMISPGLLARRVERFAAVAPPVLVEVEPAAMSFTRSHVISAFDVEPPALTFHTEGFASNTGQFAVNGFSTNGVGSLAVSGGTGTVASSGASLMHTDVRTGPDIDMPQAFISVDITARGSTGSFTYDHARLGVSKGATDWYGVIWNPVAGQFLIEQCVGGTITQWAGDFVSLSAPFRLGMSLVGNSVCVWTDTGAGWTRRGRRVISAEPRTASMTGLKPFFGASKSGSGSSSFTFDNLRAGRFGAVGMRDASWITTAAGAPIDFAGKPRATVTCADPSGVGYLGVVEVDPTAGSVRQVGLIMAGRDSGIWNDLSGHVCDTGAVWQLLNATWGNGFGGVLKVQRTVTATNITEGAHVVTGSDLALPNVPGGTGGAYDPFTVLFGGEWWVGYSIVDPTSFVGENFYIALARTSDWTTWTAVGTDPTRQQVEASRLVVTNGTDLWLIGGGRGRQPIYDEALTFVANALTVDVALVTSTQTQPWPTIGAWGDEWLMLTFDNTISTGEAAFAWGDLWLYRAPRYV
jgi:hypothetical protein